MLFIYRTVGSELVFEDNFEKGSWVNLINPTDAEIQKVAAGTNIPVEFLQYSLDDEEVSRMEIDEDQTMIIFNAPIMTKTKLFMIPYLSVLLLMKILLLPFCLEDINLYQDFTSTRLKNMATLRKLVLYCNYSIRKQNFFLNICVIFLYEPMRLKRRKELH